MTPSVQIIRVIRSVESLLSDFYGFDQQASAADHLVEFSDLHAFDEKLAHKPEAAANAGVWFLEEPMNFFIGVYFNASIHDSLNRQCPIEQLSNDNLNAFCTLVEEISHFHLILNRLRNKIPVSKLELESFGEIDKLLVSALFLKRQSGKHHAEHLAMTLYDRARILDIEIDRYEQATRVAARFWFSVIKTQPNELILKQLRTTLQDIYRTPGLYRQLAG